MFHYKPLKCNWTQTGWTSEWANEVVTKQHSWPFSTSWNKDSSPEETIFVFVSQNATNENRHHTNTFSSNILYAHAHGHAHNGHTQMGSFTHLMSRFAIEIWTFSKCALSRGRGKRERVRELFAELQTSLTQWHIVAVPNPFAYFVQHSQQKHNSSLVSGLSVSPTLCATFHFTRLCITITINAKDSL